MVTTRRRQLALLGGRERQRPPFSREAADRIREALADLLLQVSDAEMNAADKIEEASDESSR